MDKFKSYAKTALAVALVVTLAWSGWHLYKGPSLSLHVWGLVISTGLLAVWGATKIVRLKVGKVVSILAGAAMLYGAITLMSVRSNQVDLYNQALTDMKKGEIADSLKGFDASINAYKADLKRSELENLVLPESRRYLAARAYFHKANLLLQVRKPKEAVEAYKESLRLNPGNEYLGLSDKNAQVMNADSRYTAHNLELLFKSGQGGSGQGKGKGKPGDKEGKQGQDPSQDPSSRPGSGKGSIEDL